MVAKANNYGWRSRDPMRAARAAIRDAVDRRALSYASAAAHLQRFAAFLAWRQEHAGKLHKLEHLRADDVRAYGRHLAEQVRAGKMSAATAQNAVASVNAVMRVASRGQWRSVSPTRACGIPSRVQVRMRPVPTHEQALKAIAAIKDPVVQATARVAYTMGLRLKEASLLDPARALREAQQTGRVVVERGTKGGKARVVPVNRETIRALEGLKNALKGAQNAVSRFGGIRPFNSAVKRERAHLKANGVQRFHDLRAAYAARRYEALTGRRAPCDSGRRTAPAPQDRAARDVIARELGHERRDVLASYVGSGR